MNTAQVNIRLDTMLVGAIEGIFCVPSYQRGYRWGKDEVSRFLDDIYSNGAKSYCLQPVVVKRIEDRYELVDGQQRLTTLFILLKYIQEEYKPRIKLNYALSYETRKDSEAFLMAIDETLVEQNVDYVFATGSGTVMIA